MVLHEIRQVFWLALRTEWELSYNGWDSGFIPSLLVFVWWFFVSGKKTKFNSSKNPKSPTIPKRNVVFQAPLFRGYIKLEGCTMRCYALSQIIQYSFLTNQNVPWVHVTIVGFVRSSYRTIAVRDDVCGHGSEKSNKFVLLTVQPSPTDQTKQTNEPTRNPPLKSQRFFGWILTQLQCCQPASTNQPRKPPFLLQERPTNPWKEWCTVGTWPCLRELGRTTSHRTALRGGRWWLWWLGMAN